MKILIIGGTRFLGRHLVNSARARGHDVTLFNRGMTNPNLFRNVDMIQGDREKDLDQLSGQWDAVIDTCGYFPRIVRMSAEALKDKVDQYVFISSISVYADFKKININESYPVGKIEDETMEQITGESYGPLKALCEKAVQDVFGINSLIIRPGLIVGPHDPTDRFTYWPVRIARGGDVLVPDNPNALTQIIDVRDLSDFIIHLVEQTYLVFSMQQVNRCNLELYLKHANRSAAAMRISNGHRLNSSIKIMLRRGVICLHGSLTQKKRKGLLA